jgi:hypothetical protein
MHVVCEDRQQYFADSVIENPSSQVTSELKFRN